MTASNCLVCSMMEKVWLSCNYVNDAYMCVCIKFLTCLVDNNKMHTQICKYHIVRNVDGGKI